MLRAPHTPGVKNASRSVDEIQQAAAHSRDPRRTERRHGARQMHTPTEPGMSAALLVSVRVLRHRQARRPVQGVFDQVSGSCCCDVSKMSIGGGSACPGTRPLSRHFERLLFDGRSGWRPTVIRCFSERPGMPAEGPTGFRDR